MLVTAVCLATRVISSWLIAFLRYSAACCPIHMLGDLNGELRQGGQAHFQPYCHKATPLRGCQGGTVQLSSSCLCCHFFHLHWVKIKQHLNSTVNAGNKSFSSLKSYVMFHSLYCYNYPLFRTASSLACPAWLETEKRR